MALGAKFKARVVLDICEYESGIPRSLCLWRDDGDMGQESEDEDQPLTEREAFPWPRSPFGKFAARDISFSLVEGDFQVGRDRLFCTHALLHIFHRTVKLGADAMLNFPQLFRGLWRLQHSAKGKGSTRLSYALLVRPQVPCLLVKCSQHMTI